MLSHCARRMGLVWLVTTAVIGLLIIGTGIVGAADPVVVAFSPSDSAKVNGIEPVDYSSGKWHMAEAAGRKGIQLEMVNLYLQVLDDQLIGGPFKIVVTVDYLSQAEGAFKLEYDSLAKNYAYEKGPLEVIDAAKVGKWNQVEWTFESVQFANRQNGKSDMRIRVSDKPLPLFIGAVSIKATLQ